MIPPYPLPNPSPGGRGAQKEGFIFTDISWEKKVLPTRLNKIAATAFLLCAALILPACSQNTAPENASTQADQPAQTISTQDLPIAVQMWTLRSMDTLEEKLQAVQAAGIPAIELVGTHDLSTEELNRLLQQYSIKVAAMHLHMPISQMNDKLDELVAFNKAIGNGKIVMPWIPPDQRPSDAAGWIAIGQTLGEAARQVKAAGLTLAYHNHDFEIVDFDGKTALELLFEAAGPELKAELDIAWIAVAGRDPVEFLNKFTGRVFAIHAKDKAGEGHPEQEQGLADVGAGVLDWDALLSAANAAGVEWYVIEHDFPSDPAVSIKNSALFLTEHLPAAGVVAR